MVQEYDSLTVFLLNSRWKGCCLGKWIRSRLKNSFPIFVATFLLYGGLNHTVFLLRFFVRSRLLFSASYFSSWWYPASVKARWYWSLASVNSLSQLEMVFNLFWIELGVFLVIDGGWFDPLLTYLMVLFGFLYGLWEPSVDRVTSRKLIVCPFCSILMLSFFPLKDPVESFFYLGNERTTGIFYADEAIIAVESCVGLCT